MLHARNSLSHRLHLPKALFAGEMMFLKSAPFGRRKPVPNVALDEVLLFDLVVIHWKTRGEVQD